MGDFAYQLHGLASPPAPIAAPPLVVELGREAVASLPVRNPLGREVVLEAASSHPHTFALAASSLQLPPFGAGTLEVAYLPSQIGGA